MQEQWKLLLQLHGDSEVAAGSTAASGSEVTAGGGTQDAGVTTTAAEPASRQTVGTAPSAESVDSSSAVNDSTSENTTEPADQSVIVKSGGFEIYKDPVSGKRSLRIASKSEPAPASEEKATPETAVDTDAAKITDEISKEPPAPANKYNLNEFSQAIATNTVDEARVPDEYKAQYADYKIQLARQAFAEQQKAKAVQQEALKKQLSPEEQAAAMRDFYNALEAEAKKQARETLGIDSEDTASKLEFEDEDKYKLYQDVVTSNKMRLELQLQQSAAAEKAAKAAQQKVYDGINQFIASAKASEPNFNTIDNLMTQRYLELPLKEARPIEEAINAAREGKATEQHAELLRKYYEDTRRAFYSKREGIEVKPKPANKPPIVEKPGTGQPTANEYRPNYSALRNAKGPKAKAAWLNEYFNKLANKNG